MKTYPIDLLQGIAEKFKMAVTFRGDGAIYGPDREYLFRIAELMHDERQSAPQKKEDTARLAAPRVR